jgi:hypothetical protein
MSIIKVAINKPGQNLKTRFSIDIGYSFNRKSLRLGKYLFHGIIIVG